MVVRLGFSGKQGSGKSSICEEVGDVAKSKGWGFYVFSHAWTMKDLCMRGIGRKDRETLQIFGTDVVQNGCDKYFDCPEFWTNLLISQMNDLIERNGKHFDNVDNLIIVDDVRFPFQADALRKIGFDMVRFETNLKLQEQRSKELVGLEHESEMAMDNYKNWGMKFDAGVSFLDACERIVQKYEVQWKSN